MHRRTSRTPTAFSTSLLPAGGTVRLTARQRNVVNPLMIVIADASCNRSYHRAPAAAAGSGVKLGDGPRNHGRLTGLLSEYITRCRACPAADEHRADQTPLAGAARVLAGSACGGTFIGTAAVTVDLPPTFHFNCAPLRSIIFIGELIWLDCGLRPSRAMRSVTLNPGIGGGRLGWRQRRDETPQINRPRIR